MIVPMGEISLRVHSLSATLCLLVGLGVLGGLGYLSLYRAFQSKLPVGLVSALVASNSGVSTLLSWLVFHDANLGSILFIFCGTVLIAGEVSGTPLNLKVSPAYIGIAWAMVAALCLGGFNFGLGLSSSLTGAWYLLLLGSRAFSLVLLSFVLAGSDTRKEKATLKPGLFLAVGIGVAEMVGLLLLSASTNFSASHLTTLLALASCSVVLPFCYSVSRGMRLSLTHAVSLIVILFGLIFLKDQAPPLSTAVLALLIVSLVLWKLARVPATRRLTRPVTYESVRLLATASLKEMIMPHLSFQSSASVHERSSVTPSAGQQEGDQETASRPHRRRSYHRSLILSLSALFLLLIVLLPSLLIPDMAYANLAHPSVGTVSFTSSGQVNPGNTQGVEDGLSFSLHDLTSPSPGMSYYLWLLTDAQNDNAASLLVGTLSSLKPGNTSVLFNDPSHQNLLARFSRVVITQQESTPQPLVPQMSAVISQAMIPNTPTPGDPKHYSLLSHLRHLLAADPTLAANSLQGGLSVWLYRNAGKAVEWSTAARDSWTGKETQPGDFIRRHMIRILDVLSGVAYAYADVPPDSPFLADPQASHFGLLSLSPAQEPPGLLPHVAWHVQGVISSPGHTPEQDSIVQAILPALDKAGHHLQTVRDDAKKLVGMDNTQLTTQDALALMNDLVTHAMTAYVGDPNAATGTTVGGITWIEGQIRRLAVVPLLPTAFAVQ
jgi:hypothetical protein